MYAKGMSQRDIGDHQKPIIYSYQINLHISSTFVKDTMIITYM